MQLLLWYSTFPSGDTGTAQRCVSNAQREGERERERVGERETRHTHYYTIYANYADITGKVYKCKLTVQFTLKVKTHLNHLVKL